MNRPHHSKYIPRTVLRKVLERDNHKCLICGRYVFLASDWGKPRFSPHHLIPRNKGGTNEVANIVTLCAKCHDKIEGVIVRTIEQLIEYFDETIPEEDFITINPKTWISPDEYPLKNPDWHCVIYGGKQWLHMENDEWYFNHHKPRKTQQNKILSPNQKTGTISKRKGRAKRGLKYKIGAKT